MSQKNYISEASILKNKNDDGSVPLARFAVVLDPLEDHVAVASSIIPPATSLVFCDSIIGVEKKINKGHRFAIRDLPEGTSIKQFNYVIGLSNGIMSGEVLSADNVTPVPDQGHLSFTPPEPTEIFPDIASLTFNGYARADGRVGTRNYYLVIPTSMCASSTACQIANNLQEKIKSSAWDNIDGVVALSHTEGCGCDAHGQIDRVIRVLTGYLNHANVAGCLILDLGCEQTNRDKVYEPFMAAIRNNPKPVDWLTIQDEGGTRRVIEKGVEVVEQHLSLTNVIERTPCPLSSLTVAVECGASDGFSGITANPLIGSVVDQIIHGGGSAIISEIPELLGIFDILQPRFRDIQVAGNFQQLIKWYRDLAKSLGRSLGDNLVPRNIEGGLFNTQIKSIGAMFKGGSTAIEDVVKYGQIIRRKGLTIMQGPGQDLESVTGMVAGGANIVLFSTGFGTVTGNAVCPVIKVSSNNDTFIKLARDMDVNAGKLLDGSVSLEEMTLDFLHLVIAVASGKKTWSEQWKQQQFQIWTAGKLPL
jgi:altronate hydrolase